MTRPSKRKLIAREKERDNIGKFTKKQQNTDNWGDEDDNGWDDEIDLRNEKIIKPLEG